MVCLRAFEPVLKWESRPCPVTCARGLPQAERTGATGVPDMRECATRPENCTVRDVHVKRTATDERGQAELLDQCGFYRKSALPRGANEEAADVRLAVGRCPDPA